VRGEGEARPEFLQRFDRLQALARILGERALVGDQQIGVGAVMRAPDASAQLVQLRQPELVGAFDNNGVGGGYVNAGFNNRGATRTLKRWW
jgi:hypothetical protein